MKVCVLWVGKTQERYLKEGIEQYVQRLTHYVPCEVGTIADLKNPPQTVRHRQEEEGKLILKWLQPTDHLVLLDEQGRQMASVEFATWLGRQHHTVAGRLVFCVGGAYGFSKEVYSRAEAKLSLSAMTFSHQMVRLFLVEQLYRAYTILRGEKYHHQD
jgi:23S rRNA (pseudouridine1915-N3)-methyltransferase